MRLTLLYLLVLNSQIVFGQLYCDSTHTIGLYGDYPPGCTFCEPTLSGNNIGYTPDDTISYDFPCGEVENSVWYSFYSRADGLGLFWFSIENCNQNKGIQAAIYDENYNRISECISGLRQELITAILPAGQLCHIMVDGIEGDECEFEILHTIPPATLSDDIYITPETSNYCLGTEICLIRGREYPFETYQWEIPESDSIISGTLNEEEICIHFKTPGHKDFSLKVKNPCSELEFGNSLFVRDRPDLSIESLTTDPAILCDPDTVQFNVGWNNDTVGLTWTLPTDFFLKLSGGRTIDTHLVAKVLRRGKTKITVAPQDICGRRYDYEVDILSNFPRRFVGNVCADSCFHIGDDCYNFSGTQVVSAGTKNNGCDSLVALSLTPIEIFPSPIIECESTNEGLLINWERLSGVESYVIYANRDSIATTSTNSFLLKNGLVSLPLVIKVQLLGACTYLPGEIDCSEFISNLTSSFLNNKISVYPNPTTGNLNIETDLQIEEIEIYDTAGRFLQKEKRTSFDLINRAAGFYFLKIKTNEGVGVKRVIIN